MTIHTKKQLEEIRSHIQKAKHFSCVGKQDESDAILRNLLKPQLSYSDYLHILGIISATFGRHYKSIHLLNKAISISGPLPEYLLSLAGACYENSQFDEARTHISHVLKIAPDDADAKDWLLACDACLDMPGDDYYAVLAKFHETLKPRNYVEIGVAHGRSMALVQPPTVAVGIDLNLASMPTGISYPLATQVKLYPMTSSSFFANHDLAAEVGASSFDMAFIDGSHVFIDALTDFINLERYAGKNSVVLIHDCLPSNALVADPDRKTGFWTGDVWKMIPVLRKYRPDINVFTIPTMPSGLAVLTNLDRNSRVLEENFKSIINQWGMTSLPDSRAERYSLLKVIENKWDDIQAELRKSAGHDHSKAKISVQGTGFGEILKQSGGRTSRIVFTHAGVDDVMGSLAAKLFEEGNSIYFLPAGYHKDHLPYRVVADCREADYFITGDFAFLPYALLLKKPVVNVCWTNPILEVSHYLGTTNVAEINRILTEGQIYLWVFCPFAEMEYRRQGLCNSFYAPLGYSEQISFTRKFPYTLQWADASSLYSTEPYRDYLQREIDSLTAKTGNTMPRRLKISFLGVPQSRGYSAFTGNLDMGMLEKVKRIYQGYVDSRYSISRMRVMSQLQLDEQFFDMADVGKFNEFHKYFMLLRANERIDFTVALKKAFGNDVVIFDKQWQEFGIDCLPYVGEREGVHAITDINMDFNTLSFETCFSTRCFNTLMTASFPLQLHAPDHEAVMGNFADQITFSNHTEMIDTISGYLNSESGRVNVNGRLVEFMHNKYTWSDGLGRISSLTL